MATIYGWADAGAAVVPEPPSFEPPANKDPMTTVPETTMHRQINKNLRFIFSSFPG